MGKKTRLHTTLMVNTRSERGQKSYRKGWRAETICRVILTIKGYRILTTRAKTPLGEIDLVATQGQQLVFIEVKARPTEQAASEALSSRQKDRLKRAASCFLAANPRFISYSQRFDVMLIIPWRWPLHHQNAF